MAATKPALLPAPPTFDRLIRRRRFFRASGLTDVTGLRLEQEDPNFPKPVQLVPGGNAYYYQSHCERWLSTLKPYDGGKGSARTQRATEGRKAKRAAA